MRFFDDKTKDDREPKSDKNKVKIVRFVTEDTQNVNKFYGHFFKLGDSRDPLTSALSMILNTVMHN